jgi:hypothetical protein
LESGASLFATGTSAFGEGDWAMGPGGALAEGEAFWIPEFGCGAMAGMAGPRPQESSVTAAATPARQVPPAIRAIQSRAEEAGAFTDGLGGAAGAEDLACGNCFPVRRSTGAGGVLRQPTKERPNDRRHCPVGRRFPRPRPQTPGRWRGHARTALAASSVGCRRIAWQRVSILESAARECVRVAAVDPTRARRRWGHGRVHDKPARPH